eukprot:3027765-Prymnesium_polylepis.1
MMFENARDDRGLQYMCSYVAQQFEAGRTSAEVLRSFGLPGCCDAAEVEVEQLSRLLLAHVQQVQDDNLSADLVVAARDGRTPDALKLLAAGAPWDSLDEHGHSAGSYALRGGDQALLQALTAAGSACILGEAREAAARKADDGSTANAPDHAASAFEGEHAAFLLDRLRYERGGQESSLGGSDRLMDSKARPVMMEWEAPLMRAHAASLIPRLGKGAVLNIGFGMGLVDSALQARRPARHHIVEAHADVFGHMQREGWAERTGVALHFGRWQD